MSTSTLEAPLAVPVVRPARWPWLLVVVFLAMASAGLVLVALNGESLVGQASYLLAFTMFTVVGALIVGRDLRNRIGILLLWCAEVTGMAFFTGELFTWLVASGHEGTSVVALGLLNGFGWALGILPVVFFLPLLFPDGALPSPRWRFYVWFTLGFLGVIVTGLVFGQSTLSGSGDLTIPNPFFVPWVGDLPSLDPVIGALFPGLFALTMVSLFLRFRRSVGVERQQIKWVAYGFLLALGMIVVSMPITDPTLNGLIGGLAFSAFPISIGIAVLRLHLYDLDVVVKKTVVYAALAVFATAIYLAVAVGLGAWLGRGSSLLTMVAAVVVAMSFQPVRERFTRIADRIVYGRRATPYEVLTDFSSRLGDAYAESDVLPRMARVLGEGVGAEESSVWLAFGSGLRRVATWSSGQERTEPVAVRAVEDIAGSDLVLPVQHAGETLGALAVRKPPSDPVSPADEKLVAGLASQAGLVLRNVRLTEELKARLADLQAAQKRLVTAQDAERRRLERNIHDGAQQQLVALAVKARLARSLAVRDAGKAAQMLEQIEGETQQALEDLRDLARGIYPPLLADKGLVAALEAQARKSPIPVSVAAGGDLGRFGPDIEAAAYFSVLEALQNVAKYARASGATVNLRVEAHEVVFEVVDDGEGFDPGDAGYGTGLQGIADRLGALDGALEIRSAPGQGTTVRGRIPVGSIDRVSTLAGSGR